MQAMTASIREYLERDAGERGDGLRAVFDAVARAMPDGYRMDDAGGAPSWVIPLETFPTTYNGQPLANVTLMAQKQHNSLYLMGLYGDEQLSEDFRRDWSATGRKLDMGKSCLRFRRIADVDLDLVARAVRAIPVDRYLATYSRLKHGG